MHGSGNHQHPNDVARSSSIYLSLLSSTADYEYYCFPLAECDEDDPYPAGSRATSGGTVLMGGGTDVDAAFEWQISKAGGGDFLVLRESGTDAYNTWVYALGEQAAAQGGAGLRSAATLIVKHGRAASDPFVLAKAKGAGALFFAGGDQSNYVGRISGSPLEALVRGKASRVTVGGTSAGLAIMGLWV